MAKVLLKDCTFRNAKADLIDLDNATGTVRNCVMINEPGTGNGDALDLSNARLLLHGNTFSGSPDKGLSIGEASEVLVVKNRFEQNTTGIAVKDLPLHTYRITSS